jgi:hypothetical protein
VKNIVSSAPPSLLPTIVIGYCDCSVDVFNGGAENAISVLQRDAHSERMLLPRGQLRWTRCDRKRGTVWLLVVVKRFSTALDSVKEKEWKDRGRQRNWVLQRGQYIPCRLGVERSNWYYVGSRYVNSMRQSWSVVGAKGAFIPPVDFV